MDSNFEKVPFHRPFRSPSMTTRSCNVSVQARSFVDRIRVMKYRIDEIWLRSLMSVTVEVSRERRIEYYYWVVRVQEGEMREETQWNSNLLWKYRRCPLPPVKTTIPSDHIKEEIRSLPFIENHRILIFGRKHNEDWEIDIL